MNKRMVVVIPCVAAVLFAGCSGGRVGRIEESVESQRQYTQELMSIVDNHSRTVNETTGKIAELEQRLAALETRMNTSMTDEGASIQELRDNVTFLSDQLARIDQSVQTRQPAAARPQATSAFRPGGFNVTTAYDAALAEYNNKHYETAITGFKEVLTVAPSSSLADNAQYWIGECYDSLGNHEQALTAFSKVFDYPESNKLADAHVKSALIYAKMGKTDMAREEFRAVMNNYPDTNAAAIASSQLDKLGN